MQRRIQTWGLAILLVLVGVVGAVRPAAAQTGGLPTVKQPPSARFEIHGNISVRSSGGASSAAGVLSVTLGGSGAQAGANLQQDLTTAVLIDFPGLSNPAAPSEPFTSTTSTLVVDGKYYTRSSDEGGQPGPWYVADASTMPGGAGPGNPVTELIGLDPASAGQYAGALTVQSVGKETVSSGATTKYQVDVDILKLYAALGVTPTEEATELLKNTRLLLYMWVGDADSYLYQLQMKLDAQATDADTQEVITESLDLMITYRDFGAAISIVAPANALPLPTDESAPGGPLPAGIVGFVPGVGGMPTAMPVNEPTTIAPAPATPMPGMPRSGNADPLAPLALLALGLLCVGSGVLARRRGAGAMVSGWGSEVDRKVG